MNDTVLMKTGMQVLIEKLGNIDAEKFISLILREPFDYTEWRKENLFVGMTIEEISSKAMKLYNQNHGE
ncbi:MAG: hypothetical protein LBB88_10530 [Planctomycetaceae bacterium]|jgi:hypothetical protein|nr:hypothetical protein [Planctomycetaceae bacterium]